MNEGTRERTVGRRGLAPRESFDLANLSELFTEGQRALQVLGNAGVWMKPEELGRLCNREALEVLKQVLAVDGACRSSICLLTLDPVVASQYSRTAEVV